MKNENNRDNGFIANLKRVLKELKSLDTKSTDQFDQSVSVKAYNLLQKKDLPVECKLLLTVIINDRHESLYFSQHLPLFNNENTEILCRELNKLSSISTPKPNTPSSEG